MKINSLQITSATALDLDVTLSPSAPVCILRGRYADLALDLIRELIGDFGAKNDPDRTDDGRFVIHADVETDGKHYSVCYIRNADFMGDNRLAVNFTPNSTQFSVDDTREFVSRCREDARTPLFIYDCLDRLDQATDPTPILDDLASAGRQVFIAVCPQYPEIHHPKVQTVQI